MVDFNLITPNEELAKLLKKAKEPNNPFRWIWIDIDHQKCQMILVDKLVKHPNKDDWREDYEEFLKQLKQDNRPFFLLNHVDENEIQWILIHMVPGKADVKAKMVAASTKATLKNFFGSISITLDLFCEDYEDLELKKIEERLIPKSKRLQVHTELEMERMREEELDVINKIEHCNYSKSGGALHFNCLMDDDSMVELEKFRLGQYAVICFVMSPDLSKVVYSGKILPDDFPMLSNRFEYGKRDEHLLLPDHFEPGFILFRFKHLDPTSDQNEQRERYVMVCYVPSDKTLPTKMRFSYSVNQRAFVDKMNDKLGDQVQHIEVDTLDEVTVKRIFIALYPKLDVEHEYKPQTDQMINQLKFDKPLPKGRGPRRIIK